MKSTEHNIGKLWVSISDGTNRSSWTNVVKDCSGRATGKDSAKNRSANNRGKSSIIFCRLASCIFEVRENSKISRVEWKIFFSNSRLENIGKFARISKIPEVRFRDQPSWTRSWFRIFTSVTYFEVLRRITIELTYKFLRIYYRKFEIAQNAIFGLSFSRTPTGSFFFPPVEQTEIPAELRKYLAPEIPTSEQLFVFLVFPFSFSRDGRRVKFRRAFFSLDARSAAGPEDHARGISFLRVEWRT